MSCSASSTPRAFLSVPRLTLSSRGRSISLGRSLWPKFAELYALQDGIANLQVERSHLKFRTFIHCKLPNNPCPSPDRVRIAVAPRMHLRPTSTPGPAARPLHYAD